MQTFEKYTNWMEEKVGLQGVLASRPVKKEVSSIEASAGLPVDIGKGEAD